MRVGIYARVSTRDKDQRPETQLLQVRAQLASTDELIGEFVDKAGADDLRGRRRWRELLDLAQRRRCDVILVWRLDRAFRSVLDGASTLERLRSYGCGLRSLQEPWIDTTNPMGEALYHITIAWAQLEKRTLIERTRAGHGAGPLGGQGDREAAAAPHPSTPALAGDPRPRNGGDPDPAGRCTPTPGPVRNLHGGAHREGGRMSSCLWHGRRSRRRQFAACQIHLPMRQWKRGRRPLLRVLIPIGRWGKLAAPGPARKRRPSRDLSAEVEGASPTPAAELVDRVFGVLRTASEPSLKTNLLYYGDNLDILRDAIPSDSIDLIYLDPPFNSNRSYNVIFKDRSGAGSDAQIVAFEDTWQWGPRADQHYAYLTDTSFHRGAVSPPVTDIVSALRSAIGANQMMAYLVEMTVRLVELHRVLRPSGSLYLHCDSTASHYLRVILDAIFEPRNFRNEIIWRRTSAHSDSGQGARHFGRVSDTVLFYVKSERAVWNQQHTPYEQRYLDSFYRHKDPDGRRYRLDNLSGPGGAAKGNPRYEFLGVTRYWRYRRERMEELHRQGRIVQTRPGVVPAYKRYLDEMPGVPVQNIWSDIPALSRQSKEYLGYPTQKPLALLERIIATSSNPGDVVLDPFCGCGTAVTAAQKLGRRWIGIDITILAIAVMKSRLVKQFPGLEIIPIVGFPTELEGARQLAMQRDGRRQFELWALSQINATPASGKQGRGPDRGVDGRLNFSEADGKPRLVVVSVKSGHVMPAFLRELRGVMARDDAAMGILITLEEPTAEMRREALAAGSYRSPSRRRLYPRLQIVTVRDLLERRPPLVPAQVIPGYWEAEGVVPDAGEQQELFGAPGS